MKVISNTGSEITIRLDDYRKIILSHYNDSGNRPHTSRYLASRAGIQYQSAQKVVKAVLDRAEREWKRRAKR